MQGHKLKKKDLETTGIFNFLGFFIIFFFLIVVKYA